jgi:hypothetical protein
MIKLLRSARARSRRVPALDEEPDFRTTKSSPAQTDSSQHQSLDQRWEDFVDLLDVYRRRKHHLRSINRQAVQNQLVQAERSVENAPDDRERRIQQANVEILKRRVAQFNDIERSVKLVEGQLQSIENFFGLVNDQVVTLPTPERVSSLDFEQLSDSIADDQADARRDLDTFAASTATTAISAITSCCLEYRNG